MMRNCSYCGCQGHTINRCNSPIISIMYQTLKIYYRIIIRQYLTNIVSMNHFIQKACRQFSLRELKAVGVKYTRVLASSNKIVIARSIYNYFYQAGLITGDALSPEWVMNEREQRHPLTPDLVDNQVSETDTGEGVTWQISRSPYEGESTWLDTFNLFDYDDDGIPLNSNTLDRSTLDRSTLLDRNTLEPRNLYQDFHYAFVPLNKYQITMSSLCEDEEKPDLDLDLECAICYELTKCVDNVTLNCGHYFCGSCIKNTLNAHTNMYLAPTCALCRTPMTHFAIKNTTVYDSLVDYCVV